jgi:acyl-CoA-binding protein
VLLLFLFGDKGPYQPSYDMMLRFYSLFKQATDGPCKTRRPAFWDVVGRVKYDAWKKLGDLPREKAMESYVNELRQIVETMSYTQNVADFYNSLNEFDMKIEDIELIAPDVVRSKSEQNSPLHERSPATVIEKTEDIPNGFRNGRTYSSGTEAETSDDEYIDTVEVRFNSLIFDFI